jgi:hypothetical protein
VSEPVAVVPTLPPLPQELLERLPVRALVDLRRELQHLAVDVDAALAHRLAMPQAPACSAPPADDDLISLDEAARIIGCSVKWIRRNRPDLVKRLSARTHRMSKSALLQWVARRRA